MINGKTSDEYFIGDVFPLVRDRLDNIFKKNKLAVTSKPRVESRSQSVSMSISDGDYDYTIDLTGSFESKDDGEWSVSISMSDSKRIGLYGSHGSSEKFFGSPGDDADKMVREIDMVIRSYLKHVSKMKSGMTESIIESMEDKGSDTYFVEDVVPVIRAKKLLISAIKEIDGIQVRGRGQVAKNSGSVMYIIDAPDLDGRPVFTLKVFGSYMTENDNMYSILVETPYMAGSHETHDRLSGDPMKDAQKIAKEAGEIMSDMVRFYIESHG